MPFPLIVAERTFASAPALLAAVLVDARVGGGALVPKQRPAEWLLSALHQGTLERETLVGLAAALLRGGEPGGVVEGARLAAVLHDARLLGLIRLACEGHDIGLLLSADPGSPGHSVEDALLAAWADLAPLDDASSRGHLLSRLRHAGLGAAEVAVLACCGTEDEIRQWLPIVLIEGVPEGSEGAFRAGMERPEPVASLFRTAWETLPERAR